MKKITTLAATAMTFALTVLPTLAQNSDDPYGINSASDINLGTKDIRDGIMGVINVLLGFLGIIAILIVLWGGFRWMTAGGNEEKVGEAKKILTAGIIGLIIIFTSYAIATFVITQLASATGAAGA